MILVDILIVVILGYGVYAGYTRGFITVATELVSLAIGLILAVLIYQPLAKLLADRGHIAPSFAAVLAIAIIVSIFQLASVLTIGFWLRRLPLKLTQHPVNRFGGGVLNLFRAAFLIILALIVFTALPLGASAKGSVTDARIPRFLAPYIGRFQQDFNRHFGKAITDTVNFFTVEPKSEENISLGFTTTNVRVDQAAEVRMLSLVNHERESRGLNPLVMNDKAREVARKHSRDMFARGYFSHINPEGQTPFDRMEAGGVEFGAAGENLALAPTLNQAHIGLMNSPGHRANILSPDYKTVGIGVIDGGAYGLMITQDFTD